jgi:gamma-polyglutamate synthase
MAVPLIVCLLVLLALGAAERVARNLAWRRVPIRIHVNGTRAKSTVTRLIWSALREAGIPAVAKTTGTAARLLLPDGREEPLRRRGPANIREQLRCLRRAQRLGARAAVVECMALDPVLQGVSEREMVRATIGVMTNVRLDHQEVMGRDLETIAETLSNTIPAGGVLVIGASGPADVFRRRSQLLGTRVVVADAAAGGAANGRETWMADNVAIALAVTRELGIDDAVALRGFQRAPLDPGSVRQGAVALPGGTVAWIDATAANDPESLALLLGAEGHGRPSVLVYNHRDDRVTRLVTFAAQSGEFRRAARLVITGARPPRSVWQRLARLGRTEAADFVAARALPAWLRAHGRGSTVTFCGNARGLDVPRLLEEAASRD